VPVYSGDEQREAIAFLGNPASYGAGAERVDIIETQISLVFLAGDHAFKLKRALRLPYFDFSTVDLRRRACEAELVLNRRTAPSLYLEVARLARNPTGAVGFSTEGETLDWVVVMPRFDQSLLFDALARRGRLDGRLLDALADHIADFHRKAEPRPEQGGFAALVSVAETNWQILTALTGGVFASAGVETVRGKWRTALAATRELLEARRRTGTAWDRAAT